MTEPETAPPKLPWLAPALEFLSSPRSSPLLLFLLIGLQVPALIARAFRKDLWYDELLSYELTRLPSLDAVSAALRHFADGMPLTYYALVYFPLRLDGAPEIVMRLPSIAGYALAVFAVYHFTAHRFGPQGGLLAAFGLALGPFRLYAVEARPYALMVGFASLAALCWQRLDRGPSYALGLALSLAAAAACHHLAIFLVVCFAGAELAWIYANRAFRWSAPLAFLPTLIPLGVNFPFLLGYARAFSKSFWSKPSFPALLDAFESYTGLFSSWSVAALILILAYLLFLAFHSLRRPPEKDLASLFPDTMLAGLFTLYPMIVFTVAKLRDGGFVSRYGWPAIFGFAFFAALAACRLLPSTALPRLAAALLCVHFFRAGLDIKNGASSLASPPERPSQSLLATNLKRDPAFRDLPIVVSSSLQFLELLHYTPSPLRSRLYFLASKELPATVGTSNGSDLTLMGLVLHRPMNVSPPAPFLDKHPRFLLMSNQNTLEWVGAYLLSTKRYRIGLVDRDFESTIHLVEPL